MAPARHAPSASRRRLPALLIAVVLGLSLAACGGGEEPTVAGDDVPADEPAADEPTVDAAADATAPAGDGDGAAGGDVVVDLADTDLGEVLVDADGLTLYGFTNDTDGTSSCTDDCAANWPPVEVDENVAVAEGLDAGTFTTTERDDGSLQLVAGDWPLYRFAGDSAAGDVNGQGVGDVWFVVDSSGELIREAAEDDSAQVGPGSDY